jgi:chromosome partitioning protein
VLRVAATVRTASDIAAATSPVSVDADTPIAAATDLALRVRGAVRQTEIPRPTETRVLVVANQKGGVGKTTTAVNIAAALGLYGSRVLLVDLDPQGNASTALGVDHHEGTPSMYDVLVRGTSVSQVRQSADGLPNVWCAPATIDLSGAEVELVAMVAREGRLRRALREHLDELAAAGDPGYDYVFVDCPPSLGLLTINALAAGAEVFLPIQCEYYALEGVTQLLRVIDLVRNQLNPDLTVSAVLLTMYDARTRLAAQVAAEVRGHFGDVTLKTSIPRSVRISEAPSYSQTVLTYDPGSTGALSYLEAARELAERSSTPGASRPARKENLA